MQIYLTRWLLHPMPTFVSIMTLAAVLGGLRLGARPVDSVHDVLLQISLNFVVVISTFLVVWVIYAWRRARNIKPAFVLWAIAVGGGLGGVIRIAVMPLLNLVPSLWSASLLLAASVLWPLAGGVIAVGLALIARRAQEEESRAARTARAAVERDTEWRREISDNLHGRVQGTLLVLAEMLRKHPEDPAEILRVADQLDWLREGEVRRLAHELSPLLASFSLRDALEHTCARFRSARTVSLACPDDIDALLDRRQCPPRLRLVLCQVVQEGLVNAVRWSTGTEIWVTVLIAPSSVTVEVRDSGRGLQQPARKGLGTQSLDLWMLALGGTWSLTEEDGIVLRATVPLQAHERAAESIEAEPPRVR